MKRDYYDHATKEKLTQKEEFIESLTHDSYIIQVRRLRKKHRNKLETLLSIFDQSNTSKESKHFLDVLESSFPDEFKVIIRRLHKASASKELCEDMNMEDEILEELATQERLIAYERAERRKAEVEKEKAEAEKEKAKAEKRSAEEGKEKAEAEKARLEKLLKQAGIDF
ncbi:MAG: hypothetical protein Q3M24_15640 [Candidatus Electrothrix aestuarii]|uniref:Uncharacterized protein n=1 Tax=Candidatus Electrothrix aestuarii TaxID=3062594 RepID=A0AAU8LR64_9BACT|nr:hypothetical protein [Candidatus Electrothrix aestuarii]